MLLNLVFHISCISRGILHSLGSLWCQQPCTKWNLIPQKLKLQFSSVTQSCPNFGTPWIAMSHTSLSITNSWTSLKLTSIKSVMPSNHLVLCRPLLPPSIFPSIGVFSNELALRIRWPKYWSFSFSISPFSEYSWLISFRIDWFDLLAVQGTLKSLRQHHNLKASIHQGFPGGSDDKELLLWDPW